MRKTEGSAVPQRIRQLCNTLFGHSFDTKPELRSLWYQLLTGVAGTLAEAKRRSAVQAAFVVHLFESPRVLRTHSYDVNRLAFLEFLKQLGFNITSDSVEGVLFRSDGVAQETNFVPKIPFFVGKCRRDLTDLLSELSQHHGAAIKNVNFYGTHI
jgi:hypothetical protein